jgi:hypothetical protein
MSSRRRKESFSIEERSTQQQRIGSPVMLGIVL